MNDTTVRPFMYEQVSRNCFIQFICGLAASRRRLSSLIHWQSLWSRFQFSSLFFIFSLRCCRQKLFDYFISKANYNREDFLIDYEIISLQRNIKILGIFARLHLRDGKNQYINFMPRVKNFVEQRLDKTNLISPQFKNFLKVYLQ